MKTNITLRIDAELAKEAKVLAARRDTSVSRLLATELEELVRRDKAYDAAMRRALSRMSRETELDWTPPSDRGELHER
jgi:predicted transcriptional regulator